MVINVHRSSREVSVILARFQSNLNSVDKFSSHPQISNFVNIRPVGAELFHADRQTGEQTGMTKLFEIF
jgi:hypothetical protein